MTTFSDRIYNSRFMRENMAKMAIYNSGLPEDMQQAMIRAIREGTDEQLEDFLERVSKHHE